MAILSTQLQAQLQSAIDLLVKGQAYETPIAEDVIERVALVVAALSLATTGVAYEAFKNNPKAELIRLVVACGATTLTAPQIAVLVDAEGLMLKGTAYETPFAEDVIERLAPVAAATNFLTVGGFYEAIRNNPVSTMLKWALALGSA